MMGKNESNRSTLSSTEVSQKNYFNTQNKTNCKKSVNTFPSSIAVHWSGPLLFIAISLKINTTAPSLSFPHFDNKKLFTSLGKKTEFPYTPSLPGKWSATPYLTKQGHRPPDYEPLLHFSYVVFISLCLSRKRLYKDKFLLAPVDMSHAKGKHLFS